MAEFPPIDLKIEEYHSDPNRVRVVRTTDDDGYVAGPWFSRLRHTDDLGYLCIPNFALPKRIER